MLSVEYRAAVDSGDLLLAKIMMKDSFLLDPTGALLDEMLYYAQQKHPEIMEAYDGGKLESDSEKWNKDVMNLELVELIGNFSKLRIDHLRRVVKKVLATSTPAVPKKSSVLKTKAETRSDDLARIRKLADSIAVKAKRAQECEFPSEADACIVEIKKTVQILNRRIREYENNR